MMTKKLKLVPGMRIEVRDEEWRVERVENELDPTIHVVGISPLVRDREFSFVKRVEERWASSGTEAIRVVDPAETKFVAKQGSASVVEDARLFVDAVLATTPLADGPGAAPGEAPPMELERSARSYGVGTSSPVLTVGHRGAVDPHEWQLRPASLALSRPRHSVLIADAVGMGKTIECGVLLAELMRRGKGDRILVITLTSLLEQFQTELWHRFTIPLARLDTQRIQKIQRTLPSYHNPFHTYPRAIISIDTLKQSKSYRAWLEKTHWDVVVIDESQHVAERARTKNARSLRSRLASLLAKQTDTLIMLSATPHDGKAESFASLMNMLDPTAVSDPSDYSIDDVSGLVIRRFKKDVEDEDTNFQQRVLRKVMCEATPAERRAMDALSAARFATLDRKRSGGDHLFAVTLLKSFLSSPAACADTLRNRTKKIRRRVLELANPEKKLARTMNAAEREAQSEALEQDLALLDRLVGLVATPALLGELRAGASAADELAFGDRPPAGLSPEDALRATALPKDNARLAAFFDLLEHAGYKPTNEAGTRNGTKKGERFVLFSERIATLRWLRAMLGVRYGVATKDQAEAFPIFDGSLSDKEQSELVREFGKKKSKIKVLLASDAASEGVNLHYSCHRLVHFDIPWSIITFEQRNGRIDRIGQRFQPTISALVLTAGSAADGSEAEGAGRSDLWILGKLVEKAEVVAENLGDARIEWHAAGFGEVNDPEDEERTITAQIESDIAGTTTSSGDLAMLKMFEDFMSGASAPDASTNAASRPVSGTLKPSAAPNASLLSEVAHAELAPQTRAPFELFDDRIRWLKLAAAALTRDASEGEGKDRPFTLDAYADDPQCIKLVAGTSLDRWLRRSADLKRPSKRDRVELPLTTDRERVIQSVERKLSGDTDEAWQLLWEMHPAVSWIQEELVSSFSRGQSPLVPLYPAAGGLAAGEEAWLVLGQYFNSHASPRLSRLVLVRKRADGTLTHEDAEPFLQAIGFAGSEDNGHVFPRVEAVPLAASLENGLPNALALATDVLSQERKKRADHIKPRLRESLSEIKQWAEASRERLHTQLVKLQERGGRRDLKERVERELRNVDEQEERHRAWIQGTLSVSAKSLHLQPICAFVAV